MKTDWIAGLLGPWSAELTLGSIFLRLAVSMVLAAIIGCERSSKRHSAGLRTFILVSLAGTATMLRGARSARRRSATSRSSASTGGASRATRT